MQSLMEKARSGRLAAIEHLSNRRKAHRHYGIAREAAAKAGEAGRVIAPGNYHLH